MNFYFYNPNDVPQEIKENKIQKDIYCSKFNLNVENVDKEPYDYYIVPIIFRTAQLEQDPSYENLNKYIESLRYFKEYSEKHVFILQSDYNPLKVLSKYDVKIFCDSACKSDSNIYPLPFFVHGLEGVDITETNISDTKFDVSFQGCVCSDRVGLRQNMLVKIKELKHRFNLNISEKDRYFWSYKFNNEDLKIERKQYFDTIINSKFVLCPRGAGSTSSRFFESIWFGRIPILIADQTKLPLASIIPWDELIVRVQETEMDIEKRINEFLDGHDIKTVSENLKNLSRKYFDRKFLPELITMELKQLN